VPPTRREQQQSSCANARTISVHGNLPGERSCDLSLLAVRLGSFLSVTATSSALSKSEGEEQDASSHYPLTLSTSSYDQSIRGTRDLLPPDNDLWNVSSPRCATSSPLQLHEIRTPIFEDTQLFSAASVKKPTSSPRDVHLQDRSLWSCSRPIFER